MDNKLKLKLITNILNMYNNFKVNSFENEITFTFNTKLTSNKIISFSDIAKKLKIDCTFDIYSVKFKSYDKRQIETSTI